MPDSLTSEAKLIPLPAFLVLFNEVIEAASVVASDVGINEVSGDRLACCCLASEEPSKRELVVEFELELE